MKKLICLLLSLCIVLSFGCLNVFASEKTIQEENAYQDIVIDSEYLGFIDGEQVWTANIPVTLSGKSKSSVDLDDCKMTMRYNGYGDWTVTVQFTALDFITSLYGTVQTYGVAGNGIETIEKQNSVAGPIIIAETYFYGLYPEVDGYQMFKVSGVVHGLYGDGSFGPSVGKCLVKADF